MIRVIHGAWQALERRQGPLEGFWRRERCSGTMLCHVCLCRQGRRRYTVCTIQSIKDHERSILSVRRPSSRSIHFCGTETTCRLYELFIRSNVYLCAHYISRLTCVNLSPQTHCLHNCGKMPQHSDGPRLHVEFHWNHVLPAITVKSNEMTFT